MAGRPPKQHIDYAGWDINVFENDPKIDKLMEAQGCVGFVVYMYLCHKAYGSNGYYYSWCYDDSSTTARKIGGGAGAKSVEETVRYCLQIGLFDKGLFEGWNILTSKRIQKNWLHVVKERTGNTIIVDDYWLLGAVEKSPKNGSFIFHALNSNYDPPKLNYDPSKVNYDPLKESKVKESKVKDKTPYAPDGAGEGSPNPPKGSKSADTKAELRAIRDKYSFGEQLTKAVDDWIKYKWEKRQPYKPMGLNSQLSQVQKYALKYGEGAVAEVIYESMGSNYDGITWNLIERKAVGFRNSFKQNKGGKTSVLEGFTPEELEELQEIHRKKELVNFGKNGS